MNDRLPFVHGSTTSMAAAAEAAPQARALRIAVYNHVLDLGEFGATRDEVEEAMGKLHQTASARVRDLVRMECLEEHLGRTRPTRSGRSAIVVTAIKGADPSKSPPPYDPVESAVNRLVDLIRSGRVTRDRVVVMLDVGLGSE